MKILKFGGSSIGTLDLINTALKIINDTAKNEQSIVIISAFGNVTNQLISTANLASNNDQKWKNEYSKLKSKNEEIIEKFCKDSAKKNAQRTVSDWFNQLETWISYINRENILSLEILDQIISIGERTAATIIVEALQSKGINSRLFDATKLIHTDTTFGEAKVDFSKSYQLIQNQLGNLDSHIIPVIAGLIAGTSEGRVTTLGKYGSDYTASIIAAALNADSTEIWTDVDGILTADPAIVKEAVTLPEISYAEATTLAYLGAEILHPRTALPLEEKGLTAVIKNTLRPEVPGTIITTQPNVSNKTIKTVTSVKDISLIILESRGLSLPSIIKRVQQQLTAQDISLLMVSQSTENNSLSFAIYSTQVSQTIEYLKNEFSNELADGQITNFDVHNQASIIALVGDDLHLSPVISNQLFTVLKQKGINVLAHAHGYTPHTASVAVDRDDTEAALIHLHNVLVLPKNRVNLVVAGVTGHVGRAFIQQFLIKRDWLIKERGLDLRIVGAINTSRMVWDPHGVAPDILIHNLENGNRNDWGNFINTVKQNHMKPLIFIDITADNSIAEQYLSLMESGIAVVTPNKIANSMSMSYYKQLREAAEKNGILYRYETTAGAATPIIQSLRGLVESGDKIRQISGILSGTLSYVFRRLNEKIPFSVSVREAMEYGYTEPHPALDLTGEDVARKLLILIREAGYTIERDQITVESLIPSELNNLMNPEEFLNALSEYDSEWSQKTEQAKSKEKSLVYLAHFDGKNAQVKVTEVPTNSPLANTQGTSNVVTYYSDRFSEIPLTIQGPGAGPVFTAVGVLDDVIQVATTLADKEDVTKFSTEEKFSLFRN